VHFRHQENEPKPPKSKNFFYETDPSLLGTQRSQILLVQRLTKAKAHFRHQENEPKRTQTAQIKKLFLRNEPKSSWCSKITNPFGAKTYEGNGPFSPSRKRTQTNPTSAPATLIPHPSSLVPARWQPQSRRAGLADGSARK
jgi:hypothetical protein